MNYKSYQHIEKLGSSNIEGLLNGTCYLTYKIDGTNSCVRLKDDGTLGFGSRNRELSIGKDTDNSKFMETIMTDDSYSSLKKELLEVLRIHPTWIIYGEWLVPTNLKTYKDSAWKQFYIFDIYDTGSDSYINYDIYSKLFDETYPEIKYIPLLTKLENPTIYDIKELLPRTGEFLISTGLGEGIVIKNYNYRNKYGKTIWGKMLTEDFIIKRKSGRKEKKQAEDSGSTVEYNIIKLLTIEHINKEKVKLLERRQTDTWDIKFLPELLNRVFTEFFRDNWEIILKKFKNPTINFKTLKTLSDIKVKESLGLL